MKKSTCTLLKTTTTMSILMGMVLYLSLILLSPSLVYGITDEGVHLFLRSYFGYLAKSSDIIGKGEVVRSVHDEYDVKITHAMVGCTNGQLFTFWQDVDKPERFPANQSQIVFMTSTNEYYFPLRDLHYFHTDIQDGISHTVWKQPRLGCNDREWFDVDADNGEQYLYFTNLLQNIRIQKNWTNYYEICRSALQAQSPRVKDDFALSLRFLIDESNDMTLQWMLNDPLLDIRVKNYINALNAYYEICKTNPNYQELPPFFGDFVEKCNPFDVDDDL